ncbi:MAG: hypothetical protein ACXW0T_07265 [Methylobacter sp.]
MKKLLFLIQLIAVTLLYSSSAHASGGYEHHDHGWEHHHHHGHHHQPRERVYYREVVRYYPQPQPRYYPQPEPRHYYPQPQYQHYQDPRSTQGLAGGVIGSVFGYQIGEGDPIATGLGAAAGSYLGNGMAGRH